MHEVDPHGFDDRPSAGKRLGRALSALVGTEHGPVIVVALPRGGVPVAIEVARALRCPLDVMCVRKVGVPGQKELAMGACASGGFVVENRGITEALSISAETFSAAVKREQVELARRERLYRGGREPLDVRGKVVVCVDDGLATGATMRVALKALKSLQPREIVVAVPVGSPDTCDEIRSMCDRFVCLLSPVNLGAVGVWYRDFSETTNALVTELLAQHQGAMTEDA